MHRRTSRSSRPSPLLRVRSRRESDASSAERLAASALYGSPKWSGFLAHLIRCKGGSKVSVWRRGGGCGGDAMEMRWR